MKKKLAALLVCTLLLSNATFIHAEDQISSTNGTITTDVSIGKESSFIVTLPKTISVSEVTEVEYGVNCKGDIAGDTTLKVIPEATFALASEGKDSITATITQPKTSFDFSELKGEGTNTEGTISFPDITAGLWTGTLNFSILLEPNNP